MTIAQTVAVSLREIVKSAVANGGGVIPADVGASLGAGVDSLNKAGRHVAGAVSETGMQAVTAASGAGRQAAGAAGGAVKGLMDGAKGLAGGAGQGK